MKEINYQGLIDRYMYPAELESFEDDDNFEFDESKDYLGEIASACYYYDDKINDFMRELD